MYNHFDILYQKCIFLISVLPDDVLCKSKHVGKITVNK